jgi:hypothetical protein
MKRQKPERDRRPRETWERPRLQRIGNLERIVRAGGGKLSVVADPGDARKASGTG